MAFVYPLTVAQLSNLGFTAGQMTKLQQFIDIGTQRRNATRPGGGGTLTPDISMVNLVQAKALDQFLRELNTLLGPASEGAKYVWQKLKDDAAKAVDDAAVPVPF